MVLFDIITSSIVGFAGLTIARETGNCILAYFTGVIQVILISIFNYLRK